MVRQRLAKPRRFLQPSVGSTPTPSANWENANLKRSARDARRAARIGFERAFLAKRKRIYQRRAKEIFS